MAVAGSIPKGTVLSGKYEVRRELGRGGMASVYEAVNVDIDKPVAIKLLAGHLASSQTVVERFLREARAVSKIRSPHICDVYDSGRLEDGTPFLVLELLEGESLYDLMCRDRQMTTDRTLDIIVQIARGLGKAHEQTIVHRDLKPENIFICRDADGGLLVKILDFGLAKFYEPPSAGKGKKARLTRDGAVFGTPAYMSPEQVRGQAKADTRADLWALACITYECLTGTTVWSTEDGVAMTFAQIATAELPDPREYRPDLPDTFILWYERALNRDIDARYQNVHSFADALAESFGYSGNALEQGGLERMREEKSQSGRPPPPRKPRKKPPKPPAKNPTPPPKEPSAPSPVELGRATTDSIPDTVRHRRTAPAVIGLLVIALVVAAGAVVVFGKPPAPVPDVLRMGGVALQLAKHPPKSASGFKFVADHPWLPMVRESQALIAQQEYDKALGNLRRIHDEHKHGMVRNLMDHLQVAKAGADAKARCQVVGLARPRRYDLVDPNVTRVEATAPHISRGLGGALITWADAREAKRRAHAVAFDEVLRNRSLPVDITPEAHRASTPIHLPAAQRFLASYWDATGPSSGVYLRWLDPKGVIAGPPVALSGKQPGLYFADLARADRGFVAVWSEKQEADSVDLMMRRIGEEGNPISEPIRLTDFLNRGAHPTVTREAKVFVAGGKVHIAYVMQVGAVSQVRYLGVDLNLAEGLADPENREERILGNSADLSPLSDRANAPSIACSADGCFVAWNLARGRGAAVAFVDGESGKRQWHKVFAARGQSPTVAVSPSGEARLVWFEQQRIVTASLGREGVGPTSRIARIVGEQPPASVSAGEAGEWFVAWLDFEATKREPYAARIQCK